MNGGGDGDGVTNYPRIEHMTSCEYNHTRKHRHTTSSNMSVSHSSKVSKLISLNSKFCQETHSGKHEISENVKQSSQKVEEKEEMVSFIPQRKPSFSNIYPPEMKEGKKKIDNIENVLKQSFKSRGMLIKKNIGNVGNLDLHDNNVEWKMLENKSLLCPLNNALSTIHTASTTITSCKLVEPISKSPHKEVDLSWENEVIGCNKLAGIPSVAMTKNKIKLHTSDKLYSSCSFSVEMLGKARVIGPVDNKFIACVIHTNDAEEMLVLVDQHAAHERIRLERLINKVGYLYKKKNISRESSQLVPPANLSLCEKELNLLIHYKKEFNAIGLKFSFIRSTTTSNHRVFILSVPMIFVNGYDVKLKAKGHSINIKFVHEFILEQVNYMQSTGCPCKMSPGMVFKALASYACHGAIKFGDKISLSCCRSILKDLSKCKLPFQCAHGRPSIAPILKLSLFDRILKGSPVDLNFTKLKKCNVT